MTSTLGPTTGALAVVATLVAASFGARVLAEGRAPTRDPRRSTSLPPASRPARGWRAATRRWSARLVRREPATGLPELAGAAARSVAAGVSLLPALRAAGEVVGPPLSDQVALLGRRVDAGMSLSAALDLWWAEHPGEDVRLMVCACQLGNELGRGAAATLEGVAATLAQRRELAGEARTAAAQARASAALLTALPVGTTALLGAVEPDYLRTLFTTALGWWCLAGAATLDLLGAAWMRWTIRAAS